MVSMFEETAPQTLIGMFPSDFVEFPNGFTESIVAANFSGI
jgi:hypothetical protein